MVFYCELTTGTRKVGSPYKRFKDSLKSSLTACSIPQREWESIASDRCAWHLAVHQGVDTFEENRRDNLDHKWQARKERRPDPRATGKCPVCGRKCASAFGLCSHLKCH
ncbi:RNA-directed DNA polymerase from mobile element jockey [Solea senegalensis]|uniref:RNA-directed DNA polymerase from mobile element jockey n=1 Tax=Solea senegalensis TaxID=28829 RepID=A0AAV6RNQ7_SOLSE|nr:RNA-directed DNA polymerase from mobile element jockey [Solea senegalensis]